MYNIVVADDEQLERMVLRQALEEYLGPRCTVRTAANGREAVEYAILIQADIVLMDIEMPGINGLEASGMILKKLPDCKIIILTAYSEFSYAQKAIELGAADYLLKPCADKDLYAVIDRVVCRIDANREKEREKKLSAHRIQLLTAHIEEQLVLTVMGGYIQVQYVLVKLKELGIRFCNGVFAILQAQAGITDIGAVVKSSAWPEHIHPITYVYDGKLYILSISDDPYTDCTAATKGQLQRLSDAARILWGKPLYGALGIGFTRIEDAQQSCFQAQITLARCTEDYPVCSRQEHAEDDEVSGDPLISSILMGDEKIISQVVRGLIENLSVQQLDWDAIVERLETLVFKSIQKLRKEMDIFLPKARLDNLIKNDPDGLHRATCELLSQISTRISVEMDLRQDVHLAKTKKEIEDYVAAHYHEDIFLPGVAREMNYSSTYFSKLFKQCFQRNFIIYLTDIRIAAAKDLLHNTNLTIREIGERVGYKDPNYFTKVFRKATGKSPSEYKSEVSSPDAI